MKIMVVDTQPKSLAELLLFVAGKYPDAAAVPFTDPLLAAKYAANNQIHALYCEIEMKRMDGIQLAGLVRQWHPLAKIGFVTGTDAYRGQASALGVEDYQIKPLSMPIEGQP